MDSTGALNGSLLNALPLNEGRFTLRAGATLGAAIAASLGATRRLRVVETVDLTTVAATCNAIRRRQAAGAAAASADFSALFRRRASCQGTLAVSFVCLATSNVRLTAFGSCLVSVEGAASLFWKYRLRAPLKRIARVAETRNRVAIPAQTRLVSVPAGAGAAHVTPQTRSTRVEAPSRGASAQPDRRRVE
jgi:hypothetical protein